MKKQRMTEHAHIYMLPLCSKCLNLVLHRTRNKSAADIRQVLRLRSMLEGSTVTVPDVMDPGGAE